MQLIYEHDNLAIWAGYDEAGSLVIHGQDLGGHPYFDEYEYFIRISSHDLGELATALGEREHTTSCR